MRRRCGGAKAANYIARRGVTKPAWSATSPDSPRRGCFMGHAGAIVSRVHRVRQPARKDALEAAGVKVGKTPSGNTSDARDHDDEPLSPHRRSAASVGNRARRRYGEGASGGVFLLCERRRRRRIATRDARAALKMNGHLSRPGSALPAFCGASSTASAGEAISIHSLGSQCSRKSPSFRRQRSDT